MAGAGGVDAGAGVVVLAVCAVSAVVVVRCPEVRLGPRSPSSVSIAWLRRPSPPLRLWDTHTHTHTLVSGRDVPQYEAVWLMAVICKMFSLHQVFHVFNI